MLSLVMADNQDGSGGLTMLVLFAMPLLLVAYMMWSQKRRLRQVEQVQSTLRVGDPVVTTSGLYGTLRDLDEQVAAIEVAPRLVLRFDRRAVMPDTQTAAGTTPSTQTVTTDAASSAGATVTTTHPVDEPTSTTEHPSAAPTEDVK